VGGGGTCTYDRKCVGRRLGREERDRLGLARALHVRAEGTRVGDAPVVDRLHHRVDAARRRAHDALAAAAALGHGGLHLRMLLGGRRGRGRRDLDDGREGRPVARVEAHGHHRTRRLRGGRRGAGESHGGRDRPAPLLHAAIAADALTYRGEPWRQTLWAASANCAPGSAKPRPLTQAMEARDGDDGGDHRSTAARDGIEPAAA
jgi:hypothetical protein